MHLPVKQKIKNLLPAIIRDYLDYLKYTSRKSRYIHLPPPTVFDLIYNENRWRSAESVSGPGSSKTHAALFIPALEKCFHELGIKSMLDLPCGDFNWMEEVKLDGIKYTGGDIVAALIHKNQLTYPHFNFTTLDLLNDQLPTVDLIFNRDVLVHFSFSHLAQALINILNSDSIYFMTTCFLSQRFNYDIVTGDWRPLNLLKPPFNFPEPMLSIPEYSSQDHFNHRDKSLSLWKLQTLRPAIEKLSIKYRA